MLQKFFQKNKNFSYELVLKLPDKIPPKTIGWILSIKKKVKKEIKLLTKTLKQIKMKKLIKNKILKTKTWKTVLVSSFTILTIFSQIVSSNVAEAATYNFTQTAWTGGVSANTGTHTLNQTNWNNYTSKDANISAGANVSLTTTAGTVTATDDGTTNTGFNLTGNTKSNTVVSGTGANASVKLSSTTTYLERRTDYSVGTGPYGTVFDSYTNSIWVTNNGANTVSKINPSTGATIGTYSAGSGPWGIAFDQIHNFIWVTNFGTNTVKKIDPSTGSVVGTYAVGSNPKGIAYDSVTNSIWVSNWTSNTVTKLNASDGTTIGTYATGTNPYGVAFDSSTNSIWVGNYSSGTVSKFNITDGSLIGTYGVGGGVMAVTFDSSTNSVWTVNFSAATVTKVSATTGAVLTTISIGNYPSAGIVFDSSTNSVWAAHNNGSVYKYRASDGVALGRFAVGSAPVGMSFDPFTNSIWVANNSSNTISKINTSIGATTSYSVGTNPQHFAFDSFTNSLWVTNYGSNTISKINPLNGTTIGTYATGTNPFRIMFESYTNSLWVTNYGANTVSKINPSTGATIGTYATGSGPYALAFDPNNNSVWVANYGSNNVTKINASNGNIVGTYDAGAGNPNGIAYDTVTASIWVPHASNTNLAKINSFDGSTTATYTIGGYSGAIVFDTVTNSLWMADYNSGNARKINPSNGSQTTYPIYVYYDVGVGVDTTNNTLWFIDGYYKSGVVEINPSNGSFVSAINFGINTKAFGFDSASNSIWLIGTSNNIIKMKVADITYSTSGTYTSGVTDLGTKPNAFTTVTYSSAAPSNTTLTVDVRAGDSATVDGSWTSWMTDVRSGGDISSLGSHRYVQYRVNETSSDGIFTPTFNDITFNYNYYPAVQTLTSSSYDTNSSANLITKLSWTANNTSSDEIVKFQVRSSSDNNTWSAWCGYADCSGSTYFTGTDNGVTLATNHPLRNGSDDRYLQYKMYLYSGGAITPTVTSVSTTYVVNAPPEFNTDYPTLGAGGVTALEDLDPQSSTFGKVVINYSAKDPDGSTGTVNQSKVLPSFEYSTDGGSTWHAISSNDMAAGDNSLKDILDNSYTIYTAVWDAKTTIPNTSVANAKVRVTLNDNEAANNTGIATTANVKVDTLAPSGTITFDAGIAGETNSGTIAIPMPTDDSAVYYRIQDTDTNTTPIDTGWVSITESTTIPWTFDSDIEAKSIKYNWKDVYGNISSEITTSTQTPVPTSSFLVQDTSNVTSSPHYYDMYIGWQAADSTGFGSYKLEYATSNDNSTYSAYTTINDSSLTNVNTNYYVHRSLDSSLFYRYRLGVVGTNGNITVRSNAYTTTKPDGVQNYGEGGGGSVATASKIENVVVTQNEDKTISVVYQIADPSYGKKINPSYEVNLYYNIGITLASNPYSGGSLTLSDASKLTSTGYILINNEVIKYTSKTGNVLSGLTRGTWSGTAGRTTRSNASFFAGTPVWILANGTTPTTITNTTITTGQNESIVWDTYEEVALAGSSYPNVGIKVLVHDNQDALSGPLSNQNDFSENGILNTFDLTAPSISFTEASGTGAESVTPVSITVNLSRAYPLEITVPYETSGTADTMDFTLLNGNFIFSPGETTKTITAGIVNDVLKETNEDIVVTMLEPINAALGINPIYTYTITDDDLLSTVQFPAASGEGSESTTTIDIPVTLSEVTGADVVMSYSISGTATGGGVDYTLTNGTLTIPKGQISANISAEIIDDNLKEEAETIVVTLGWPTNADMGEDTIYTYTILDDDTLPTVEFPTESSSGSETLTSVQIPITLSSAYPENVTVDYTITGGTATSSTDYTLANGTATISAGQTMTTIPVTVNNDTLSEGDETIIITLSNPTLSTLGTNTVFTYTITDDEIAVTQTSGSNVKATSAVITWTTAEFADSKVEYGTVAPGEEGAYNLSKTKADQTLSHSVYLSGLTPLTHYYFKTTSTALSGEVTTTEGDFTTTAGPVISATTSSDATDSGATITWTTDIESTSAVYYGTDSTLASPTRSGTDELTTTHTVNLTNLAPGSTYYFYVQSVDAEANISEDANDGNFYTFETGEDVTPPVISNILVPVAASDAMAITWTTNEPADSQVSYGTSAGSYTVDSTLNTNLSTNHLVALGDLEKNTTYYFVIKTKDAKGNETISPEQTATTSDLTVINSGGGGVTGVLQEVYDALLKDYQTLKSQVGGSASAPVISNVAVDTITPFSAKISFETDIETVGFVDYGKSTALGATVANKIFSKFHKIIIYGLTMGTDYHFKVTAMNKLGDTTSSEDQTFKTKFLTENMDELKNIQNVEQFQKEIENTIESILPSLVPPFIEKPDVSDITENSVTVSFKTNIKAFPVVSYATDAEYDIKKTNPYTGEISDSSEKAISHKLGLIGLKPNTKYHIMAKAFSLPQVVGKSEDITFTTKAAKIQASVTDVKNDSFTVLWTSDEPTSSIVEYKNLKTGINARVADDTKNTSHSVRLTNLTPGTNYEVNVSGVNALGNLVEAGASINVQTLIDVTAPIMSNLKVDSALVAGRTDRVQTIVSWQTDEPSDSIVYYQEGSGSPDKELANKQVSAELTKSHVVILTAFKPGTVYRFQVSSTDTAGNMVKPPIRTLITPRQNESIVDVIFKNFDETFNFIKNVGQ